MLGGVRGCERVCQMYVDSVRCDDGFQYDFLFMSHTARVTGQGGE